jgi:hypothetical protein
MIPLKCVISDAAERAIATFAQTGLGIISAQSLIPGGHIDWQDITIAALIAALLSILKSLGAYAGTTPTSPSLTNIKTNKKPPTPPT